MGLNTPLIEYLIVGTQTAVWMCPLLCRALGIDIPTADKISAPLLAAFLPFIYLLGMTVDQTIYLVLKRSIRSIKKKANLPEDATDEYLCHASPSLYAAYSVRVKRVRILAAGIFNWPLIGVTLVVIQSPSWAGTSIISGVALLLAYLSWRSWKTLYARAYGFRKKAFEVITTSNESANPQE
jgi:hypothetical protein